MKTSLNGKKFLAQREACVLVPYEDGRDPISGNVIRWSIGYGDKSTKDAAPITITEAWAMLDRRLEEFEGYVNRHLGGTVVSQQVFDALIAIYYNTGPGGKKPLIALIKAGDLEAAADKFLTYNKVKGATSIDHTKRRIKERDVFLDGNYGDLSTMLIWEVDPRAFPRDYQRVSMPE